MRTIDETLSALKGLGLMSASAGDKPRPGARPIDPATDGPDAWAERSGDLARKRAANKERKRLETLKQRRKRRKRRKQERTAPPRPNEVGWAAKSAVAGRGEAGRDYARHGASKRLFVDWLRAHPWSTQAEIKAGLDGVVPRGSIRAYCTNGKGAGYLEAREREMGRLYPGGPPRPVHEYRVIEGPAAGVRPDPLARAAFLG